MRFGPSTSVIAQKLALKSPNWDRVLYISHIWQARRWIFKINFHTVLSRNNHPLLVGDIFSKSMKEAWFCYGKVSNVYVVADFGHPRPIFNFFVISKKALFRWYTFGLRIFIFESCAFYQYFGHVFYLQWKIYSRYFK